VDPHAVLALCREHAEAEAVFDIDRVLATLVPEPLYEFHPAGRVLSGWSSIERFYRSQYPVFASQVVDSDLLGEWSTSTAPFRSTSSSCAASQVSRTRTECCP
jgi:hypothetical protein